MRRLSFTFAAWSVLAVALSHRPGTAAPAQASDPGLLFHAAFDGTTEAVGLGGVVKPAKADAGAAPAFEVGRFGQALVCGPDLPLRRYPTAGHVVPAAGTVSLWVKPVNWTPADPNFHSFFESGDGSGFGITTYGYAEYTSYLYPGGLNLGR